MMRANSTSLLHIGMDADLDLEVESDSLSTTSNHEAEKIQRNSLYLTFNAPQVDEYVCIHSNFLSQSGAYIPFIATH